MADDEVNKEVIKPKSLSSKRKEKAQVPTVSQKVDEAEEEAKKPKRKSSSKKSKKKSSTKKSKKEESQANLLDPKIEENNTEDEKSKRSKSSRKSSDTSLRDQLADSHSSLKDYFPDAALKNYLQGLHDDVESLDGDDNEYSPRYTPSPILLPTFPPSQLSGKVFLEKDSGFRSTTQRKLTSKLPGNQIQPDLQKPSKTPLDLSLDGQRIFRSLGIFCHGFLAGLAFWQLLVVFILSAERDDIRSFIELYSPLSQPLHLVFYFLTVVCTISILDRYDIAKFEWRHLQKLLTLKSGGLAILVYAFSLVVTLVTTRIDDKLSLYQHNATLFDLIEDNDLEHELTTWKALNLCRSIAVILGWIIVSLRPNTDLLYKNLKKLSTYEVKQTEFKAE